MISVDLTICGCHLLHRLLPIQARSGHGDVRVQWIHLHELGPDPRTVRAQALEQASHRSRHDRSLRCCLFKCSIHLCSGHHALNLSLFSSMLFSVFCNLSALSLVSFFVYDVSFTASACGFKALLSVLASTWDVNWRPATASGKRSSSG